MNFEKPILHSLQLLCFPIFEGIAFIESLAMKYKIYESFFYFFIINSDIYIIEQSIKKVVVSLYFWQLLRYCQ